MILYFVKFLPQLFRRRPIAYVCKIHRNVHILFYYGGGGKSVMQDTLSGILVYLVPSPGNCSFNHTTLGGCSYTSGSFAYIVPVAYTLRIEA